jgi:hypothetical protein
VANPLVNSDKVVLAVSTIAMGLPSSWTIAWAIEEKGEKGLLYWNLGWSMICLTGALADIDFLMWLGFIMVCLSYGYVLWKGFRKRGV